MFMQKIIQVSGVVVISLFCFISCANAATYYMDDNDCDNSWVGSEDQPICDLHTAFDLMDGGDTLIIGDGVYVGERNIISHSVHPPSGDNSSYTLFKGENIGKAIFDGENNLSMMSLRGGGLGGNFRYMQFENIIWRNTVGTLVSVVAADHIKLIGCGVYDVAGSGQCCDGFFVGASQYVLLEDCFSYGSARKHFYIGRDADKVIVRRGVVRHDRYSLYNG